MKLEIEEIATISLKDDEYLIIRLPKDAPGMRVRRLFESLGKILPPDYAKRTLVYVGELQLDKVKFLKEDKKDEHGRKTT